MKHLNEQTQAIADSISEASHRKGIQWTRVTWYSWSLATILFLLILPGITFYIGTQYQAMRDEEAVLNQRSIPVNMHQHRAARIQRRPVACVMDAKICPDGTSVGRVPPNCEFAACPGGNDTTMAAKPVLE
jgi:hypothetical protein